LFSRRLSAVALATADLPLEASYGWQARAPRRALAGGL